MSSDACHVRLSAILVDYLSSSAAIAAGAPALTAVQRLGLMSDAVHTQPRLMVVVTENEGGSASELRALTVRLELHAQIGTEQGQTTRAAAAAMMQAFARLLGDTDTFTATWNDWITTQDADYLAGWCLQSLWRQGGASEIVEADNALVIAAEFEAWMFWG